MKTLTKFQAEIMRVLVSNADEFGADWVKELDLRDWMQLRTQNLDPTFTALAQLGCIDRKNQGGFGFIKLRNTFEQPTTTKQIRENSKKLFK